MPSHRFNTHKPVSLRHVIADDIRQAIIEGRLKSGERLVELELSKQMGVSRGPIREALRVLEQEGLIHSHPYKETVVAEFSAEEVVHVLIPIRLTVELYALRKAIPLMNETDFNHMQTYIDEMRASGKAGNIPKLVDYDLAFHEYIVRKPDLTNITNMWSNIYNRIRLHFLMQDHLYEDISTTWKQHQVLLDAIRTMDIELSCAELNKHIYDSNIALLKQE
ncbi:hypothetical protein SY83_17140 [Paenibacillus swuensis]|uniref:HTH gntR-type domain-containing protein n=1 Tax=Paenibacillus swuensis TaxID=1178515 RepID=A0A172TL17_9BACL|nr:GntR family transcriptional regulator [Paenibacillus swuensis]ANE47720.1 hypothetical protein SY83_17140 [Paenibacillus swuensis]